MNDLQGEVKRLRNLKNYKKYNNSSLERVARINLWKKQANIKSNYENSEDKIIADQFFNNYLSNYDMNDFNDVQNVVNLVFEEVMQQKIQKQIDKTLCDTSKSYVPDKTIQSLHSIQERIWTLKEKIGIVGTKEVSDLTALQELEKKQKIYIAFNRNEFTFYGPIPCKDCGSTNVAPFLIRRRCNKENFDTLKHPFFAGRFYFNRRGIELVKENIWTKEQYAWVFQTSVKFVDWCIKNEHKIVEIDGVEDKEIQEFINNTDYLRKENIPEKILDNKRK